MKILFQNQHSNTTIPKPRNILAPTGWCQLHRKSFDKHIPSGENCFPPCSFCFPKIHICKQRKYLLTGLANYFRSVRTRLHRGDIE